VKADRVKPDPGRAGIPPGPGIWVIAHVLD
jgi:hypothetical protein